MRDKGIQVIIWLAHLGNTPGALDILFYCYISKTQ